MLLPPPFPISIDALTVEILTEALGAPVTGFTPSRIGADRGMLGEIFLLTVDYHPEASGPSPVVAKFAALREGSLASARRAGTHERELRCYDELLTTTPVEAPRHYACWYDPDTAHFLLLQEAVAADESIDQVVGLDVERAKLVLAEAAKLHGRWLSEPALNSRTWLPRLDSAGRRTNLTTIAANGWELLCELLGDELNDQERALGAELPDRIDAMLCDVANLPSTLIHSDLRTDNLLFSPDGHSVSLIDWQGAGIGPPGFDLAYFLTQCLSVADRRANEAELFAFYRNQLVGAVGDEPTNEVLDFSTPAGEPPPGYRRSILYGLAIACALPLVADPKEPRVRALAATITRRTIDGLRDHDQLWTEA